MPRKIPQILTVDDDAVTCELLCEVFAREGFGAVFANSGEAALNVVSQQRPDLLLSDIRMKTPLDGLSLLEIVRREYPSVPVVLMTAFGSIETAVRAVKEGAFDYISKPFNIDELVLIVRRALANGTGKHIASELDDEERGSGLIGRTPAMLEIYKMVARVSDSPAAVLITGESGTGKELVARAIHRLSPRRNLPFISLNCAAIPTGLLESEFFGHEKGAFTGAIDRRIGRFELANQGTIFLDEVEDIPLELQSKLLRVLQEHEFERLGSSKTMRVDVRVVAATNADLSELVAEKKFRSDLFYRLNVFPINVPPLRERPEDIPLLVNFFAHKFAQQMRKNIERVPKETMAALTGYHWPGNVRELQNLVERGVILTKGSSLEIPLTELKQATKNTTAQANSGNTLEAVERDHILRVLGESNWVIGGPSGAAARLGMNRTTLNHRMRKLGIFRPQPQSA